jgi:hypothetical protein
VHEGPATAPDSTSAAPAASLETVVSALRQVSEDLRAVRALMEKRERAPHD